MRRLLTAVLVVALTGGLSVASAVLFGWGSSASRQTVAPVSAAALYRVSSATLQQSIARLQDHLRTQPRDAAGWATLGLAYVEQARVSADPAYYPKAAAVLDRSLQVQPLDNEPALTGQGALAAARHDFPAALRLADQSLRVNPYGTGAQGVRIDALVELGRYQEAYDTVRRADAIKPGIPIFTRYAYVMELRGHPDQAQRVLELAAGSATDPGDVAYVATQLGELAWNRGDYGAAGRHFATALRANGTYIPALDGSARVRAARGDIKGAISDRVALVGRVPLPSYLVSLGELYESRGMPGQAREQYAVIAAWNTLARANGVATDLETALVAADHGDPAAALQSARAEWQRRCGGGGPSDCSVHVDDALAWALHVNGKDREALGYAGQAARTGYRSALFLYHRGMIEKSLGRRSEARRDLTEALRLNPHFSELHAPKARKALEAVS